MIKKAKIVGLLFGILLLPAKSFANTSVTLAWNPSSGQVSGYKVYCTLTSSSQVTTSNVGNVTSAAIGNLTEGQTYTFAVTAYDANNVESSPSSPLSYTVPSQANPSKFVRSETAAHGNWRGLFGAEGAWIPSGIKSIPSYMTVNTFAPEWIWEDTASSWYAPYANATGSA